MGRAGFDRELEITLIVSGHGHDRAGAVAG
jgi:hypothetical protein